MFAHCTTFAELNAAYEQAVANVKTSQTMEQALADLAAGRTPDPDDRIPQWDAIKEAMHARWSELSGEPWPDAPNSRGRVVELRAAAKALLIEQGVNVEEQVVVLPLAKILKERENCSIDAAKRHIARAVRLARGEISQERWGGYRPGAGRPKTD